MMTHNNIRAKKFPVGVKGCFKLKIERTDKLSY